MSDGPHRSLPMRPGWKKLAERAGNAASSAEEVRDAVPAALEGDWHKEIQGSLVREVRKILSDSQTDFFYNQRTEKLELLQKEAAGYPLAVLFLTYATQAVAGGLSGDKALEEAASQALADCATRGARQVEEHYYRKATQSHAADVRRRIESGIEGSDIAMITRRLVGIDKSEQPQRSAKRTGLDDGVQL